MSAKTEKKLENLENDVEKMEVKYKEFQEKIRKKREKTEKTRNLAIVEIVRENKVPISVLKIILNNGGKPLDNLNSGNTIPVKTTQAVMKETAKNSKIESEEEYEEII